MRRLLHYFAAICIGLPATLFAENVSLGESITKTSGSKSEVVYKNTDGIPKGEYNLSVGVVKVGNSTITNPESYYNSNISRAKSFHVPVSLLALTEDSARVTAKDVAGIYTTPNLEYGQLIFLRDGYGKFNGREFLKDGQTLPEKYKASSKEQIHVSAVLKNSVPTVTVDGSSGVTAFISAEQKDVRLRITDDDLLDKVHIKLNTTLGGTIFECSKLVSSGSRSLPELLNTSSDVLLSKASSFYGDGGAFPKELCKFSGSFQDIGIAEQNDMDDAGYINTSTGAVSPSCPAFVGESDKQSLVISLKWNNTAPTILNLKKNAVIGSDNKHVKDVEFNFDVNDPDFPYGDKIVEVKAVLKIKGYTLKGNNLTFTNLPGTKTNVSGGVKVVLNSSAYGLPTVRVPTSSLYPTSGSKVSTHASVSASELVRIARQYVSESSASNLTEISDIAFDSSSYIQVKDSAGAIGRLSFGDSGGLGGDVNIGPFLPVIVHSCKIEPVSDITFFIPAGATTISGEIPGIRISRCPLCDPKSTSKALTFAQSSKDTYTFTSNGVSFTAKLKFSSEDTASISISGTPIGGNSAISSASAIPLKLKLLESGGESHEAVQLFSIGAHSTLTIGAFDQDLGVFHQGDTVSLDIDPKVGNLCSAQSTCSSNYTVIASLTPADIGLSARYDTVSKKIHISGTVAELDAYKDKDVVLSLKIDAKQDGDMHPKHAEKAVSLKLRSEGKLVCGSPSLSLDGNLNVSYSAGSSPASTPKGIVKVRNMCGLCESLGATLSWSKTSGDYGQLTHDSNGVTCTVSFGDVPFSSYGVGSYTHTANVRVQIRQGGVIKHSLSLPVVLRLTVTQPAYDPIVVDPQHGQIATGAKIIVVGPKITVDASQREKITNDVSLTGTFVTGANTPTFDVNENNVDFGSHSIKLQGSVRTGDKDATVGKPLILEYDKDKTIPIGGDIGIVEIEQ